MVRSVWKQGIFARMINTVLFMSTVSCVVIASLLLLLVRPAVVAAQEPPARPHARAARPTPPPRTAEYQLSRALRDTLAQLEVLDLPTDEAAGAAVLDELEPLRIRLVDLDAQVRGNLEAIGRKIEQRGYPAAIQARHLEAADRYDAEMASLLDGLARLDTAAPLIEKASAIGDVADQLRAAPLERPHQPFDPNALPFARPATQERTPRLSQEEFAAGGAPALGTPVPTKSTLPEPGDLEENEDVQITPAIQTLAGDLGGDPLAIYQWVHNNIDFIATFGSVQGSQMTLEAGSGNAFDIASLLIALLRAAGVPSRYVQGTIEVPAGKVQNWLGDAATPQVAQQILGQGGIPNVGLLSGGELTHIRLEHAWVEAFVDYVPSRGARPNDSGNSWVPLDAAFKQHVFTPSVGFFEAQPFPIEDLTADLLAVADVDAALGRIANIDEDLIFAALQAHDELAGSYFQDGGFTPSREALLGNRMIVPVSETVLAGSLPAKVIAAATPVATLPSSARVSVSVRGFASQIDRALGNVAFSADVSLPRLNSKRLGLTYEPATAADAQIIQDAEDSGASDLPLYLIQVRPVLKLDDEILATGPAVGMGRTQFVDVILRDVGDTATIDYQVIAGDESVFGITANGVTSAVVDARFAAVPSETAAENLHQTGLGFWMESDFFNELTAQSLGVYAQRRPSVGLFGSPLNVSFLFGVPRSGHYEARIMDVKRSFVGVAGEDPALVKSFVEQSGMQTSYLEGLVHDQLFSDDHLAKGFSAVDLIGDANRRGIATYFITSDNVAAVLPLLQVSSAVKTDVANSVAAGKTVLIPESQMERAGWLGVGYIVRDEVTGAGGYLISGGLNGGLWTECIPDLSPLVKLILAIILAAILIAIIIAIIKSLGTLGPVLQPAFAAIVALIAILVGTSPAYAAGGFRKGGQADPKNCPPLPPPPPCEYHTTHSHFPCVTPPDHWHYFTINQGPAPTCFVRVNRQFGGCGPPPVPCPPC